MGLIDEGVLMDITKSPRGRLHAYGFKPHACGAPAARSFWAMPEGAQALVGRSATSLRKAEAMVRAAYGSSEVLWAYPDKWESQGGKKE